MRVMGRSAAFWRRCGFGWLLGLKGAQAFFASADSSQQYTHEQEMRLVLAGFQRPERRFPSFPELVAAINQARKDSMPHHHNSPRPFCTHTPPPSNLTHQHPKSNTKISTQQDVADARAALDLPRYKAPGLLALLEDGQAAHRRLPFVEWGN